MALDSVLREVVAAVESGGSGGMDALRFEPGVYEGWPFDAAMKRCQASNGGCSIPTARMISATSWGRFQILGYNLYLDGYSRPVAKFLASAFDQEAALETFLTRRSINWTWADLVADPRKAETFTTRYNGPAGWPSYFERMKEAAPPASS